MHENISRYYSERMRAEVSSGVALYEQAMKDGICTEQARMFLPAYAMYVRWRWTASLNSLLHFCSLRLEKNAQWEITEYARAIAGEVKDFFPYTYESWMKHRVG